MSQQFQHIIFEKGDRLARIVLNRPPLNILTIAMMDEISQALEAVAASDDVNLVVFSAQGRAFSAGVAVEEHTADKVHAMISSFHRMFHTLAKVEVPSLAVVQGAALGGGCELVAFCDLVLAAEGATFGQPEIKVGVFPGVAVAIFPQLMGRKKALELILLGETLDARAAREVGLVNQVVPDDQLEQEAERWIQKLRSLSGAVLRTTKRALYAGLHPPFVAQLQAVEPIYLQELMALEDAHEGLRAFLEKRRPEWRHR